MRMHKANDMRMIDPIKKYSGYLIANDDNSCDTFTVKVLVDFPQNASARGYFIRPGRDTVELEGVITTVQFDKQIAVTLDPHCYTQVGAFTLAVKVQTNDMEQTLVIFEGNITETTTDTVVLNESVASIADLEAIAAATARSTVGTMMQGGEIVVAHSAAGQISTSIEFPAAFVNAPRVFCNCRNGAPNGRMASAGTASRTGVTITTYANSAGSVYVSWLAVSL